MISETSTTSSTPRSLPWVVAIAFLGAIALVSGLLTGSRLGGGDTEGVSTAFADTEQALVTAASTATPVPTNTPVPPALGTAVVVPTPTQLPTIPSPTATATPTPVPPTATSTVTPTPEPPTATPPPTATAERPAATAEPAPATATATSAPATSLPASSITEAKVPTATLEIPTSTATQIPPTATADSATATPLPATATPLPATATPLPATATAVPATATLTPLPATATPLPATATLIPSPTPVSTGGGFGNTLSAAEVEANFIAGINSYRSLFGLPLLTHDPAVSQVARNWSAQMAAQNAIPHNPNLGNELGGAVSWAENVGMGNGGWADLHQAFLDSEGHERNIRLPQVERIGLGVVFANGLMFVTQVFVR